MGNLFPGTYDLTVSGWDASQAADISYQIKLTMDPQDDNAPPLLSGPAPAVAIQLDSLAPPSSPTPTADAAGRRPPPGTPTQPVGDPPGTGLSSVAGGAGLGILADRGDVAGRSPVERHRVLVRLDPGRGVGRDRDPGPDAGRADRVRRDLDGRRRPGRRPDGRRGRPRERAGRRGAARPGEHRRHPVSPVQPGWSCWSTSLQVLEPGEENAPARERIGGGRGLVERRPGSGGTAGPLHGRWAWPRDRRRSPRGSRRTDTGLPRLAATGDESRPVPMPASRPVSRPMPASRPVRPIAPGVGGPAIGRLAGRRPADTTSGRGPSSSPSPAWPWGPTRDVAGCSAGEGRRGDGATVAGPGMGPHRPLPGVTMGRGQA